MELSSKEERVNFVGRPDERQALLVRQEAEIGRPGRGVAEAPLEHDRRREPEVAVERRGGDEVACAAGFHGQARLLRDHRHRVAVAQAAERAHGEAAIAGVEDGYGVAEDEAGGIHPSLERPDSPRRPRRLHFYAL